MPKQLAWEVALEAAAKGDAGYLWTVPVDEDVALSIDLESITLEEKDDVHKWPWVSVGMETPESKGEVEQTEIPFWCKKPFFALLKEMKERNDIGRDGIVDIWFRRTKNDKDENQGTFRNGS